MNKTSKLILISSSLILSACASHSNWSPTVDPYGSPNAYRLNQDLAECRELALQASGGTAQETAKGSAVGALIGAATGAAFGAISGNPGSGAAYGAVAGGIGGATKQGFSAEDNYKRAYNNCLRHRGHFTLN